MSEQDKSQPLPGGKGFAQLELIPDFPSITLQSTPTRNIPDKKQQARPQQANKKPTNNKFHKGNPDGKHYWLTPPDLRNRLQARFDFTFDPCPYPKPNDSDGLTCEWGESNYVNPPFGSIMHQGKKKGMTAWVRKAIDENRKGKRVVMVYPIDKWVLMLMAAGAKVENLGDVRWCATEDGSQGKGMGRHIAMFILEPNVAAER
jgi:hypothetical protein